MKFSLFFSLLLFFLLSSCNNNLNPIESNNDPIFLWTIDHSIKNSNLLIENKTNIFLARLEKTVLSKKQYQLLVEKAINISRETQQFNQYINELRERLVTEAGGTYSKKECLDNPLLSGKPHLNDKKIAERFFITEDKNKKTEGKILEQKLSTLKNNYINNIISLWDNGGVQGSIFASQNLKDKTEKEIKDLISIMYAVPSANNNQWVNNTFEGKSVGECFLLLRKIQNDVLLSQRYIFDFLGKNMGKIDIL